MSNIEAVVSDADGTLVNTVSLIRHGQYKTTETFLTHHGIPSDKIPSYQEYEILLNSLVGGSARQTLERTVKAIYNDQKHYLNGIDYNEIHNLLDPIQDNLAPEYVTAFPGLSNMLTTIGTMGIKFAIFSSGTPHHIVRNFGIALKEQMGDYASLYLNKKIDDKTKLEKFKQRMSSVFKISQLVIITCDDVGERTKPDPLSVKMAMNQLNVHPSNTLVLGDHTYDIQAAEKAKVPLRIGITHGFDDKALLMSAGATKVIDSLDVLVSLLTEQAL